MTLVTLCSFLTWKEPQNHIFLLLGFTQKKGGWVGGGEEEGIQSDLLFIFYTRGSSCRFPHAAFPVVFFRGFSKNNGSNETAVIY